MTGASITSRTGSTFVIQWGLNVLRVDLKSRNVSLRFEESRLAIATSNRTDGLGGLAKQPGSLVTSALLAGREFWVPNLAARE